MHFASGMSVPFLALKLQSLGNALDMFTVNTTHPNKHLRPPAMSEFFRPLKKARNLCNGVLVVFVSKWLRSMQEGRLQLLGRPSVVRSLLRIPPAPLCNPIRMGTSLLV